MLKQILPVLLVLAISTLPILTAGAAECVPVYVAPHRAEASTGSSSFMTYSKLAEKYGFEKTSNWNTNPHRYTPASGQPLNAFLVTHPDCRVGISRQGMFSVEDKGISSISSYLRSKADEIQSASKGAIRFVKDPDQADILVVMNQRFIVHGNYRGSGKTVKGYSTGITFYAYCLSDETLETSMSKTNVPGQTVSVNGSGDFWMNPPVFKDTADLKDFVSTIMGWYGCDSAEGSEGIGVARARRALANRGYLEEAVQEDLFDPAMTAAVKRLQAEYGLENTGKIDRSTMLALYYDQAAVTEMLRKYPAEEQTV